MPWARAHQVGTLSKAIGAMAVYLRVARFDRFFVLARAPFLFFDFASAGDRRGLPGGIRALGSAEGSGWSRSCGRTRNFQAGAEEARISV